MTTTIVPGGRELKIAGVPLTIQPAFAVFAALAAAHVARNVGNAQVGPAPPPVPDDWRDVAAALDAQQAWAAGLVHPSLGWVIAAAAGAVLVYTLSILFHELGHLLAARALGVETSVIVLDLAGGYVVLEDEDRLTAGRIALIVAAGPLVTAALALGALAALALIDLPVEAFEGGATSAGVVAEQLLTFAVWLNAVAFAVNLLPFRMLDGGQLLRAVRLGWVRWRRWPS